MAKKAKRIGKASEPKTKVDEQRDAMRAKLKRALRAEKEIAVLKRQLEKAIRNSDVELEDLRRVLKEFGYEESARSTEGVTADDQPRP